MEQMKDLDKTTLDLVFRRVVEEERRVRLVFQLVDEGKTPTEDFRDQCERIVENHYLHSPEEIAQWRDSTKEVYGISVFYVDEKSHVIECIEECVEDFDEDEWSR